MRKGEKMSDEQKKKISESGKGKKHRPFTAETKKKMSEAHKGKKRQPLTAEHKKNISIGNKGKRCGEKNPMFGRTGEKSPWFGKKHDAATIAKMSEAQSGEKNPMFGRCGEKHPNYKHGLSKTKEYGCVTSSKRRATEKNQTPELTDIEQNKIHFIYQLAATMADVHIDHYQPLSKGGLHHPDNLQILDAKLNLEKKDKWPLSIDEQKKYHGLRIGENMSTDKQLQYSAGGV